MNTQIKIHHVAIYVLELERTKAFFEHYFHGTSHPMYENKTTGLRTYFITFDGGAQLELMWRPELLFSEKSKWETGFTHLAFSVGSKEKVDQLTETLKQDGYNVLSGPRTTGDGYYESCVEGPEQNIIEITE